MARKSRGFSAARRAYEDDELLVLYVKVEILHSFKAVGINLAHIVKLDSCHFFLLYIRRETPPPFCNNVIL